LGAVIEEEMIPTTEEFRAYCERFNEDANRLSLHVGEDYVLLGTVPAEAEADLREALRSQDCEFYPIGRTVSEAGLKLKVHDGSIKVIGASGWDHFK
jgi:thiamine monophosphate kinase